MMFKYLPFKRKENPQDEIRHAKVVDKLDSHSEILGKQTEILERLCHNSEKCVEIQSDLKRQIQAVWEEQLRGSRGS